METAADNNDTAELTLMEALKDPNVANHMASSNHEDCNDHQKCKMENSEGIENRNEHGDSSNNEGFPETVTILEAPTGGKVYLVGTAHFSEKSQQDVAEVILFLDANHHQKPMSESNAFNQQSLKGFSLEISSRLSQH